MQVFGEQTSAAAVQQANKLQLSITAGVKPTVTSDTEFPSGTSKSANQSPVLATQQVDQLDLAVRAELASNSPQPFEQHVTQLYSAQDAVKMSEAEQHVIVDCKCSAPQLTMHRASDVEVDDGVVMSNSSTDLAPLALHSDLDTSRTSLAACSTQLDDVVNVSDAGPTDEPGHSSCVSPGSGEGSNVLLSVPASNDDKYKLAAASDGGYVSLLCGDDGIHMPAPLPPFTATWVRTPGLFFTTDDISSADADTGLAFPAAALTMDQCQSLNDASPPIAAAASVNPSMGASSQILNDFATFPADWTHEPESRFDSAAAAFADDVLSRYSASDTVAEPCSSRPVASAANTTGMTKSAADWTDQPFQPISSADSASAEAAAFASLALVSEPAAADEATAHAVPADFPLKSAHTMREAAEIDLAPSRAGLPSSAFLGGPVVHKAEEGAPTGVSAPLAAQLSAAGMSIHNTAVTRAWTACLDLQDLSWQQCLLPLFASIFCQVHQRE